jgi:PhnB protein
MATANLNPYLFFNGNCKEAMEFYHSVLGGDLQTIPFGNMHGVPDELTEKIMYSVIRNDSLTFMASDCPPGWDYKPGNNVTMSLSGDDGERLRRFWDGLSAGGVVTMKLERQMWGDDFGSFTDKFGIHWLVNITGAK